jgi:hypothetical protein
MSAQDTSPSSAAVTIAEEAIMHLRRISYGGAEGSPVEASKALIDIATRAATDPVIKAALENIETKRAERKAAKEQK